MSTKKWWAWIGAGVLVVVMVVMLLPDPGPQPTPEIWLDTIIAPEPPPTNVDLGFAAGCEVDAVAPRSGGGYFVMLECTTAP